MNERMNILYLVVKCMYFVLMYRYMEEEKCYLMGFVFILKEI